MPSQETESPALEKYTITPLLLFHVLSYSKLQAIESMLINHITLHSINFHKNHHGRTWVKVSPSEFAKERGYTRQRISEALGQLVKLGFIESQESIYQTNSGFQKGREFRLVSNQKLNTIYELLSTSIIPLGDKPQVTPQVLPKVVGDKSQVTPCQATGDTLSGHRLHLVTQHLSPWGVKLPKSLKNLDAKYSLNNIKEFINTFSEFGNSYLQIYSENLNSRRSFFKLEMQIGSLIRQYSLFSVFVAMMVNLFSKDAQIGDISSITAFLKINNDKLKFEEENLRTQCGNLFSEIFEIHMRLSESDLELENFYKIFRQDASILLTKKRLEASSSGIFIYDGFLNDALDIFQVCNFNSDSFTFEILKKLNLYYKNKILGSRGLNFVQSLNH